jgi:hypothetical protein
MQSSQATEQDGTLQSLLAEIADVDKKVNELSVQIDNLKGRRESLERLACEEFAAQRLDGVRVAGRSWRIEHDHHFSVPADRRDAVLAAAAKAGLHDKLLQVNTQRLKTLLKEQAKEAGRDARGLFSEGTPFAGLVGEYVQPKLRHLTLPG